MARAERPAPPAQLLRAGENGSPCSLPARYLKMLTERAATSRTVIAETADSIPSPTRRASSPLTPLRRDTSLTPSWLSQTSHCAALTFPPFGLGSRRWLLPVSSVPRILRSRDVHRSGKAGKHTRIVSSTAFGAVAVRLVRRERVEVVSTAAWVEPGEPVDGFLAETPQARRWRFMPDRRAAQIERPVLS